MGTPTEIKIRPMHFGDIPAVCEIEKQSFTESWSQIFFQNCLKRKIQANFVVELDKKILAYAVLQILDNKEVFLLKLAVDPNFRRHNLGKNFLAFLINFAKQWGGINLKLHVNTKNIVAIRLYESCGFKISERLENFYESVKENAFTMERKI